MPVYHSRLNEQSKKEFKLACNAAVCPLNEGSVKGPAPAHRNKDEMDIVDEALHYFRANILFNEFDVQGPADRVITYLTAWIADCLRALTKEKTKAGAKKAAHTLGINKKFPVPGDSKFPFGGFFAKPASNAEKQLFADYFQQIRHESVNRLIERCYKEDGTQNKFWFQFSKQRFMGVWNM